MDMGCEVWCATNAKLYCAAPDSRCLHCADCMPFLNASRSLETAGIPSLKGMMKAWGSTTCQGERVLTRRVTRGTRIAVVGSSGNLKGRRHHFRTPTRHYCVL